MRQSLGNNKTKDEKELFLMEILGLNTLTHT